MLSEQQIAQYQTFGFVVLRQHLDRETMALLSEEVDRAFLDAFGDFFFDRPDQGGGIEGHYLPVMGSKTPLSRDLVEDSRLCEAAEELLGGLPLPTYAEAILYFDQAGVHQDDGIGVTGVKFAAYLEPLDAGTGAPRFIPGSHHPDYAASVNLLLRANPPQDDEELRRQVEGLPCFVAETEPGDVIAFDLHVFHGSIRGRDRRQWTVTYHKDPATAEERERFRLYLEDDVRCRLLYEPDPPYEVRDYPLYDPRWVEDAGAPTRARFAPRLRELGVFEALERWSR